MAVATVAGITCVVLCQLLPVVSPLLVAIVLGLVVGNLRLMPHLAAPGVDWVAKPLLRAGIVVLGAQLSLASLASLGWGGVATLLLTVVATYVGTLMLGRLLTVPRVTRHLIATGFAICGASAVAALSSIVHPDHRSDEEVAQSIALVTLFGTVTLFALPLLQPVVGFDDVGTGIWIGAIANGREAQSRGAARAARGCRRDRRAPACIGWTIRRQSGAGPRTSGDQFHFPSVLLL